MTTNRVLISLPDNYVNKLKIISDNLKLNKSDIIRRALDDYFKKNGEI